MKCSRRSVAQGLVAPPPPPWRHGTARHKIGRHTEIPTPPPPSLFLPRLTLPGTGPERRPLWSASHIHMGPMHLFSCLGPKNRSKIFVKWHKVTWKDMQGKATQ